MAAEYTIFPLTENNAREITSWRYDPPYDLYDLEPRHLEGLLNPDYQYHQVLDAEGNLVGFCCFGIDAQVPGGEYDEKSYEVLDVGVGMRPELTGQGLGEMFVAEILDFGRTTYCPEEFRVTVAGFNKRSLKTFQKLGFMIQGSFIRELVILEFYQLVKPVKEQ